ncbi:MAG: hypothetical protein FWG02_10970 [Holophagaceae bacterium]|nr:hypothetical protein [Holophagaceae bacterium]
MVKLAQLLILAIITSANFSLFAQTKIELVRTFIYEVPKGEDDNRPGKRVLSNNPWRRWVNEHILLNYFVQFSFFDEEYRKNFDGTTKIHNYDNDNTVPGMYRFKYESNGYSGHFNVWFPAVYNIKKIEFFDKDNNKMFEDVFDETTLYNFEISKISSNSFSVPSYSRAFLSIDGAKTWKYIEMDSETNTFTISNDFINKPDAVIVVIGNDPNPPHEPGVALWAPNPSDYVFEFADDEEPPQTVQSAPSSTINSSSNNATTNKGFLSRIFGK